MTSGATTVADMLHRARALGVERLDVQRLLAHVLTRPRSWLAAHDDATLDAVQSTVVLAALERLAADAPLAYVLGEQEFHGLVLHVNADVLVPRPDTEVLVDWALQLLAGELAPIAHPRVVDLGTGSGAIALAVQHAHRAATVLATDISIAALEMASANATRLGLNVSTLASPWWAALGDRRFHLALSNPPYIAGGDPHLGALRHEPMLALTPGGDGLSALRQIIGGAAEHLEPRGWLLLEHGYDQADAVRTLLRERDFSGIETRRDLGGRLRCTGGQI